MAKSKNTLLALAIVALVGFFVLKQAVKIDVGTPSVSKLKPSSNGLQIDVKLPILNRSDFSYPIEGFLGQILYGPNALGNVTLKQPITIPARASAEPEFTALLNWSAIATEAYTALDKAGVINWLLSKVGLPTGTTTATGAAITWSNFKIHGTLYVGGLAVDIDQPLA